MTSVCRPPAVQALKKPVCTLGWVPRTLNPRLGGCAHIQTCQPHHQTLSFERGNTHWGPCRLC